MDYLQGLLDAYKLKDERRTGWELRGIDQPESVGAHSWGVSFLTLIYGEEEGINVSHALRLATVHDLAEAHTGDIPTRAVDIENDVSTEEKHELETKAIERFADQLDRPRLRQYWEEYAKWGTSESKFVKDMDLIDNVLQALYYEEHERYDPTEDNPNFQEYDNLDEFFATAESRFNTTTGETLFNQIKERYEEAKQR